MGSIIFTINQPISGFIIPAKFLDVGDKMAARKVSKVAHNAPSAAFLAKTVAVRINRVQLCHRRIVSHSSS